MPRIPKALRQRIIHVAHGRCEYCLTSQEMTFDVHEAQTYLLHLPVAEVLAGQQQTTHIEVLPAWDARFRCQ